MMMVEVKTIFFTTATTINEPVDLIDFFAMNIYMILIAAINYVGNDII